MGAMGAAALVLVVRLTVEFSGSTFHSGGDPGGRILKELRPTLNAVPTGASNVVKRSSDATWSGKCPDNPSGRAGWSEVRADASFDTSIPKDEVVLAVNSALLEKGWVRHDESFGPGQGPVAHWTKRLATGGLAEAAVFPVPAGSTDWFLTATSKPPGFALPGC